MKIIAVSYVANMGKSQTIQMTYHKFKPKYLPKILLEDINNNDITIISEVTFDFRLIRVGFASGGDWKMLCICLFLGNILGVCCDYSGRFLAAKFGKDN